jgi:D-sedoheptulose 7-phosphate isomerase
MTKKKSLFKETILNNVATHLALENYEKSINKVINVFYSSIKNNGKILMCGNGGSAADAQHLSAELLVRLKPELSRKPLPAITLAQDTSTLTACGNDFNFNDIFLRSFQALSNKKDVLLVISTSGNSKNIIKVLKYAKAKKIKTVGFLGKKGGLAKKYCDHKIIVPSNIVARIQECHIFLGHYILEQVEKKIFK